MTNCFETKRETDTHRQTGRQTDDIHDTAGIVTRRQHSTSMIRQPLETQCVHRMHMIKLKMSNWMSFAMILQAMRFISKLCQKINSTCYILN